MSAQTQRDPEDPQTVPEGIPQLDANAVLEPTPRPELLIITGMSGAGRSRTSMALQDLDWYVVDNLPPRMITAMSGMMTAAAGGVHRLAVVVDVRSREFFADFISVLDELRDKGVAFRILFLDAADDELVRRYEYNRRPHPLQGSGRMLDAIRAERELLAPLRARADVVISTTNLNVHDLARKVREVVAAEDVPLRIALVSFGFKYGIPLDADHVVDMRFLANPYWVTELRHLTGKDAPVRDYVLDLPTAKDFASKYVAALELVLAGYQSELKPYATVAVGCTGGKHRSVAMAEHLGDLLRQAGYACEVSHRDLGRE
ncbi:RNase adapter RapZ [Buchananella hordeovulneris]|uniref:RNase adaptor protein RapZ n=1 Tax=Buchananella hordeovulneris TaxID=52770 RepID=A0A1Q5PXL0_9ACTO|nr:RNase adapter RapZ [Buchananella hordeovulneris]OKL52354.1 RNase adaptor protein RapZ [Buchananella hordeovulneris]RRD53783.1 RNase adapter RapZ [Buchananella hordeovulneris]